MFKKFSLMVAALVAFAAVSIPSKLAHAGSGFSNEKFCKVFYFEHGGKGSANGSSAGNAAAMTDVDLMSIDAGSIIDQVWVVVDTAVTGTSAIDVGDDDDADGFCPAASLTLGSAGLYCSHAGKKGVYLYEQTFGVSQPTESIAPQAKYYAAAGKEVKLDFTGASSAGKGRVIVCGFKAQY